MPDPEAHPDAPRIRRVALHALLAGLVITGLKFTLFVITNSVVVLTDGLESIINLVAAGALLYSVWLANRPADREHPYGHGKIEFMTVGLEGWFILIAGLVIAYESIRRLVIYSVRSSEHWARIEPRNLEWGLLGLGGITLLAAALATYVWLSGRRHDSPTLIAHGKHLATDVASTFGGLLGLALVHWTGRLWLDPIVALLLAAVILFTSWRLLWHSVNGLMDRIDPADEAAIRRILDEEVATGTIRGYHKVRHRHSGSFHWVDMHLQMEPHLSVAESHELASRIEYRIEQRLGHANATAHVEPWPGPPQGRAAPPRDAESAADALPALKPEEPPSRSLPAPDAATPGPATAEPAAADGPPLVNRPDQPEAYDVAEPPPPAGPKNEEHNDPGKAP